MTIAFTGLLSCDNKNTYTVLQNTLRSTTEFPYNCEPPRRESSNYGIRARLKRCRRELKFYGAMRRGWGVGGGGGVVELA